jgi:aspartyl-tRNA synthetase
MSSTSSPTDKGTTPRTRTGPFRWTRSHNLGELNADHSGKEVVLMGWVHRRRDHGQLVFIDLRDRHGITQVVIDPAIAPQLMDTAASIRNEFVIAIKGTVQKRPDGMINKTLPTGGIEVSVSDLRILNGCDVLPFPVSDEAETSESLRLKYRYLDLRRPRCGTTS